MAGSRKFPSIDPLQAAAARCLDRHVAPGSRSIVALSGGVDSVTLLHAVCALNRPVAAIHVHHGLYDDADRWADYCRDLCGRLNVPLNIERVSVERGSADGMEAAARRARHEVFSRLAADWILLAHHRGDRAETILFNLLRGAGARGAGAMPERAGRLLRPLLTVGRDQIVTYAAANRLDWVEDASNADTRFSRNFLRHRILPALRQRFPAAEERLAGAADRFAEAADLLDELARLDLGATPAEFPLPVHVLRRMPEARARNLLRYLLTVHGVGIPAEERLVEALRQMLTAGVDRHPAVAFGEWLLLRKEGSLRLEKR